MWQIARAGFDNFLISPCGIGWPEGPGEGSAFHEGIKEDNSNSTLRYARTPSPAPRLKHSGAGSAGILSRKGRGEMRTCLSPY